MGMQIKQSIEQKSKYRTTVKRRVLASGTIIAVLLLATPYFFYLYQGFPENDKWESFFGVYYSQYYQSVQVMAWVLFGKLIPFFLLLIWFLTCKHWWYHALLVPIGMYLIQIVNTLNEDLRYTDTNDFVLVAPIVLIMAIFLYTVRTRVFDRIHGIDLSELSRVNWKGEIVDQSKPTDNVSIIDSSSEELEEDEAPLFMG